VGYNGTPNSCINCFEGVPSISSSYQGGCERCNLNTEEGKNLDLCFCTSTSPLLTPGIHAEENCILEAGIKDCKDATLFCTIYPCLQCSKIIMRSV